MAALVIGFAASPAVSDTKSYEFVAHNISLIDFLVTSFPEAKFSMDSQLSSYRVSGHYQGGREGILNDLSQEFSYSYLVDGDAIEIWMDGASALVNDYDLTVDELPLVEFFEQIAVLTQRYLAIDTTIDATVTGRFSGTMLEILDTLALQYSVLIDIDAESLAVVDESRGVEKTFEYSEAFAESNWIETASSVKVPVIAAAIEAPAVELAPTVLAAKPAKAPAPKARDDDFFSDLESLPGFY